MSGMTESAQVQRINAQCLAAEPERPRDDKRERYRHRATNKPHYRSKPIGAVASTSHSRASLFTRGESASRTCR